MVHFSRRRCARTALKRCNKKRRTCCSRRKVRRCATLEALERMRSATRLPLIGQPNAGNPRSVDGRNIYLANPDYLVAWARRALRSGVRVLGGCCGTHPEHIQALRSVVDEDRPERPAAELAVDRGSARAARPAATRASGSQPGWC